MIEILALFGLYGAIGKMAQAKGLPKSWGWLGVGMWIGGEVLGFLAGPVITGEPAGSYLFAILGALTGGLAGCLIVQRMAPAPGLATAEEAPNAVAE